MDNFPTIGGSSAFQSASLRRGSNRGRGGPSGSQGTGNWGQGNQGSATGFGSSNFQAGNRPSRGSGNGFGQSSDSQRGKRGGGFIPTGSRPKNTQSFGEIRNYQGEQSQFQAPSQGFQGGLSNKPRNDRGRGSFNPASGFGTSSFNPQPDQSTNSRVRSSRGNTGRGNSFNARGGNDTGFGSTPGGFQSFNNQRGGSNAGWTQDTQSGGGRQSFPKEGFPQNMGPRDLFNQGPQVKESRPRLNKRGSNNNAPWQSSNPFEQQGNDAQFKRPPRRGDFNQNRRQDSKGSEREQGRNRSRGEARGRGNSRGSSGPNQRGNVRGRGAKTPITSRIKKAENPNMDEEDGPSPEPTYMNEEYSGEEEASYYSNDGNSYSRSASYEQSDEYADEGSLSDGGSREELADRAPPRGQLLKRPEGKARDSPPKPKINVMDRIKPIKSTEVRDPPQRPAIVPHKPVSTLAAPPPPPRVEAAKERIRKAPLEIPLAPSLSARRSEREQEGTPHNKEVNSKLLAKVDRFGDNELMTRKYRLFLQKRKKKCAGAPRDLMTLINKLETLDLTNTSCFAMCSQEEIGKRQFQGDIDLLERTDSATEKKMRPDYAIKKFTRSSADQHLDKPELLRPPFILSKTLEHIMTRLLDDDAKDVSQFPPPNDGRPRAEYLDIYLFVGDRLRSVKQDIQILSSHCPEIFTSKLVIQIYEQIVRFYILSCNELLDRDGFDPKINLEQLSSAFTSLMQCYKLSRQSLAAFYLKYNGTVDAFIDMVEEVVFISPCEAEFMSLNLLMLYFEKEASFQTALQSIEKDHPEVMDSKHFDAILKIVSMLSNRNYAQYLRSMAESKDLLLGHVMGLPEFINTIRIKYFCILKNLSFNQGRGEGSMDNEGGEEAPLSEYQKRLHIDTLEEMKYFLTFMYGKKNKGVELFSVERNVINLGHYQADVSELLSKISKIKLNKPIQSLKACLAAISPLNKRECSVKGPKKENSQIIKTVHQNIFSVIKRAVGDYKAIEEEPLSEEIPSEEELVKVAPTRQVLEPSKADSSLIKKKIEIDNIDQLIDKAGRKKKGAEKALLLLKKKVRTVRREVYRLWSMYSIAKSAQQLEKLKEYLDAKNEQTRFECFDQWRLQVYRRQALLEEIMEIPDFEGGMDDVVCEEYKNLTYLPHYNYYQSFIMYLFRHLLRKWFEVLAPQTILAQNLGTVQEFRLSWLFVIDRSSPDCRYLAPFLGLFLISPEESLTAIIEGTTIETEYFVENWIDRAGIVHPGRLSLAVTLQCRTAAEVSKADVLENDFIVAFGPHSVAPCLEKWCQEARQAAENKYESANDAHFASFGDLLREAGKDVIRIVPDIENCSLLLASEAMTLKDVTWRFFNFQVNHATLQAFLSVCLKRVSEMIDWVDETFFSGQFLNLKILEKTKTFGIETLLRSFHNSLLEVDSQRAMILTDDGLFMDLESQRYMRKLVIKDIEGFFYLRNLVAAVIKEIMLEAQVFPRENPGSVRLLQGLHAAILSEEINNDVYLNSSRNMIFYNYLANIMAECSPRWRALFEIDINKVIWTQIITLVAFNPIDNFSGDWLMFFIHLLECIAECLKLSAAKSNVRLVADFELRMLLDINFEDLYATAKKDHQKFLMRQYWTSERHQEFTSEIVRHSEDNLLQQSALLHDQLTPQTHTPSVSDLGEEPTHLGKRQDHIEFCYSTLNSQFFTRLLKL